MSTLQTLTVETQNNLLEKFQVNNVPAKELVQKLSKFIGEYDLNKRKGFKFERDGIEIQTVILSNEEETLKVIYTNTNGKEEVFGSVIVEERGQKILKGYEIIDEVVVKTSETLINDEFLEEVKEISKRAIPNLEDRSEVAAQLPCIYGNWCGPGCSGPSKPISSVDTCCQSHDKCYGSRGYFACSCDRNLQNCLAPYVRSGSEWAIVISAWFLNQPCNPFA